MHYYQKVKKNIVDICNICEQEKKLSYEHVPPQCCGNNESVAVKNIFAFDIKDSKEKLDSQNGIKYRTICEDCNNRLLGANVDKEMGKLYKHIKDFMENETNIGKSVSLNINLVSIIKCLFGKLLAIDKDVAKDYVSVSMREFILNNKIADNLHVYFRLYPYVTTIHLRSCSVKNVVKNDNYYPKGFFSVLYFYPLAFIVSSDKENDLALADLMDYVDFDNPIVKLNCSPQTAYNPITNELLPYNWLAVVGDDNNVDIMFLTESSVAIKSIKKLKNKFE